MRPSRTAARAGLASVAASTYHWSVRKGSIGDLGAVAVRDGVGLGVGAVEPALLLGEGQDRRRGPRSGRGRRGRRARRIGVDAVPEGGVVLERDAGARVHHVDGAEACALADVPVVEVVGGGDLDGAGALLGVGVGVGDDGDGAADQRQADGLADEVGVARVVGVDGDAGVAEHGLGAGGGDDEVVAGLGGGGARLRRRIRWGARRSRRSPAGSAGARGGPSPRPARPRGRRWRSRSAGPS